MDAVARFLAKVRPASGECWEWVGALGRLGYGSFRSAEGPTVLAHRWAYEHYVAEIPSDREIDHLTEDNIYVSPKSGKRACRVCRRRRASARRVAV